jgi:hypothetical protein
MGRAERLDHSRHQRIAVEKPRVRSKDGREVPLKIYDEFQDPKLFEEAVLAEGIKRVSQRDYETDVRRIANSFGFKKSQVWADFIEQSCPISAQNFFSFSVKVPVVF